MTAGARICLIDDDVAMLEDVERLFKDVEKSFRLLNEFAHGPGYVHVSPRTVELAWQLLPKFFGLCPTRERLAQLSNSRRPSSGNWSALPLRADASLSRVRIFFA